MQTHIKHKHHEYASFSATGHIQIKSFKCHMMSAQKGKGE